MPDLEAEKKLAAVHAVQQVQGGMVVGLGTGSTTAYAVGELARRVREGLQVTGTATSRGTEVLATRLGIPLVPFAGLDRVDLTIDGADEVDPKMRAIKGGGGALFREKVVATASDQVIVVVDSSKPVEQLGRFDLPIETVPFAYGFVLRRLAQLGMRAQLRVKRDGEPFLTDEGNWILDIALGQIANPAAVSHELKIIPGVLEHGLFLTEIDQVVIARGSSVETVRRQQED